MFWRGQRKTSLYIMGGKDELNQEILLKMLFSKEFI